MTDGRLRFLAPLAAHVGRNRRTFARVHGRAAGHPVARRLAAMIERLVEAELGVWRRGQRTGSEGTESAGEVPLAAFLGAGLHGALVRWSATSTDATHLRLLEELDRIVARCLRTGREA